MKAPIFYIISCQYLLLSVFYIIVILVAVTWFLVVSICVFIMINDVEHLFIFLLAVGISLEKCLFQSFAHFYCLFIIGLEFFLYCGYKFSS